MPNTYTQNLASWLQPLFGCPVNMDIQPLIYLDLWRPILHCRSSPVIPGLWQISLTTPNVNPLFFLQ